MPASSCDYQLGKPQLGILWSRDSLKSSKASKDYVEIAPETMQPVF